jgi:hypothetical protein
VYVGIDVSKTELVVAVRPSSESFTLAYHRAGLKQLVGRLGELRNFPAAHGNVEECSRQMYFDAPRFKEK